MKKYLIRFFVALLLLPLLGVVSWYCVSFLPHVTKLEEIRKQGDYIVSSAPQVLYPIAVATESKETIRTYAMHQAYYYLAYNENSGNMLSWHLNNALWFCSSYFHLNDKDVFSIWAYYSPYKGGRGLNNAALYYFKKPLSELDERGLAALLALAQNPSRYEPGTEESEHRIEQILAKLKKT